jgi:hypothetical protein
MDETELISSLQSRLSQELSVPVRTSGLEDERPVPVVIIDDWSTTDMNFHNSPKSGEATGDFDDDGEVEHEWYLNFDFETNVEFAVRHHDEVEVSRLKADVKEVIRIISANPQWFHSECKEVTLGVDGSPSYRYTEPKEAELIVSARFHGDHTITRTSSDTQLSEIEQLKQGDFTFNP